MTTDSPYRSTKEQIAASWTSVYLVVVLAQVPSAIARFFVVAVLAEIVLWIAHEPHSLVLPVAWVLAVGPFAWSLMALVIPSRGFMGRNRMGARAPSQRERDEIDQALAQLAARDEHLPHLEGVWVLDGEEDVAYAVGDCIVVSRGCIENSLLCGLAHELGHLANHDGRHIHAINRLLVTFIPGQGRIAQLLRGDLGIALMTPVWAEHWRVREHAADHYAARLGCGEELADFFESYVAYDRPVPYRWLSAASHPPTEYRIERLREAAAQHADQPTGEPA